MDLTGLALMPGKLAKYLTKSDCRSLKRDGSAFAQP